MPVYREVLVLPYSTINNLKGEPMFFNKKDKQEHKVCMYVEMNALKVSDSVQRDINLEDILLNHTQFYDDKERALQDGYIPLQFATTVRTVFSNRVVGTKSSTKINNHPIYYINLSNIEMFPHKGLDLVMYLSSIALFSIVEYRKGFDDLMLHSEFQSIGIYNPDPTVVDPIIYNHIYIDDSWEKDFEKYMNDNSKWYDIKAVKKEHPLNLKAIIDTLIITTSEKEETKNEYYHS